MPKFGKRSNRILSTCHEDLQKVCNEAIKYADFSIISGQRGEEEQNDIYDKGFSKSKYPSSKHNKNPSDAVDIAPYPIDWNDSERFYLLAGIFKTVSEQLGIKLRWGGDWDGDGDLHDQTFMDIGHFERSKKTIKHRR